MSVKTDQSRTGSASTGLRIFILALFAIVTAIISVSFAAHHMRIGYEEEYADQLKSDVRNLAAICSLSIDGNALLADPSLAATKYASVLPALLVDSGETNQSKRLYGLYAYTNGTLTPLIRNSENGLVAAVTPVSEWLTVDAKPYLIEKSGQITILTPVKDSKGNVVGVFELSETYSFLDSYGNSVEKKVMMSVIFSVVAGIILFSLQYLIPEIIRFIRKRGEKY